MWNLWGKIRSHLSWRRERQNALMKMAQQLPGRPNACCRDARNLKVEREDPKVLIVHRCTCCGRRHYRMFAKAVLQPGKMSIN